MLTHRLTAPKTDDGKWAIVPAVDYYWHAAETLIAMTTGERVDDLRPADEAGAHRLPAGTYLELVSTQRDREEADDVLARAGVLDRPYAVLNPGGNNEAKRWPADRFAALHAAAGRLAHRFARHVKACTKAGIAADQTLWYQGYQQGLPRYCTPLNGLSSGQAGRTYHNVCPAASADGFLRGYRLGRAEYDKRQTVQSLNSQIRAIEGQSDELGKLLAAGGIDEQEAKVRQFRYRGEIMRLRLELQQAERELSVIQRDGEIFASNPDIVLPPRY